jgi:hypothetical protein
MARMGHDSERAAMIYQHEAQGADQAITDAIGTHVQALPGCPLAAKMPPPWAPYCLSPG